MSKRIDAGLRVGEYVVEGKLGEGAFGEVWRARHAVFDDVRVALKIPRDARAVARLGQEAALARRVTVDGAVRLLGIDPEHDPPYLALQLVEGESLRESLKRGRLSPERTVAIARRIFGVLEAAHAQRILHRDVKPENVLIDVAGDAFLTDFGLAIELDAGRTPTLASSLGSGAAHGVVGTIRYMAPEQKDPLRPVDHRADLYAAGLVLFEMLTGTLPEGGEVPSDLVPGLDPGLDHVFRRCYARLERRCGSAREAISALDAVAERQELARRLAEEGQKAEAERPHAEAIAAIEAARAAIGVKSPLVPWDDARALLRVSDTELLRLVDASVIGRVSQGGSRLFFRRSDVVGLRRRVRRVVTPNGRALRVLPAILGTATTTTIPIPSVEETVAPVEPIAATAPVTTPAEPVDAAVSNGDPRRLRAAGLGIRAAAFAVDATCIAVAAAVVGTDVFAAPSILLVHVAGGPHLAAAVSNSPAVLVGSALLSAAVIYFTALTALFGRTIGKWLLGLRIVGLDGEPIGPARAAARSLSYLVSATPFGLGFVSAAMDPDHRAFHDIVADSRVVYE